MRLLPVGGVGLAVGIHLVKVGLVGVVAVAQDVKAEAVFLVADAAQTVSPGWRRLTRGLNTLDVDCTENGGHGGIGHPTGGDGAHP